MMATVARGDTMTDAIVVRDARFDENRHIISKLSSFNSSAIRTACLSQADSSVAFSPAIFADEWGCRQAQPDRVCALIIHDVRPFRSSRSERANRLMEHETFDR